MTLPEPLTLDIRPELARGNEPFAAIMAATDRLAPGQWLRLIAPFRPVPLFNVMANRGFAAHDQQLADGSWEVLFSPEIAESAGDLAPGSAPGAMFWPDPVLTLDLCRMAPPEAGRRVLARLELLTTGEVLFALFQQVPLPLLPELAQRQHEWAGNAAADGSGYRLLIRKGGPGPAGRP